VVERGALEDALSREDPHVTAQVHSNDSNILSDVFVFQTFKHSKIQTVLDHSRSPSPHSCVCLGIDMGIGIGV
jgi:hypothetical protein